MIQPPTPNSTNAEIENLTLLLQMKDSVLGLWLIASPWLLGFAAKENAMWTSLALGLLVVAVSLWAVWDYRHPHAHA
jgi:SPW repeat